MARTNATDRQALWQSGKTGKYSHFREGTRHLRLANDDDDDEEEEEEEDYTVLTLLRSSHTSLTSLSHFNDVTVIPHYCYGVRRTYQCRDCL